MIDFNNTEIAFAGKSNRQLSRALILFRLMASQGFVKTANFFARIAHAISMPLGWIVKPTLYRQFVGGETFNECMPEVRMLEKYNVKAILDYSVEGGHTPKQIEHTLCETLRTIENAAKDKNIPFAVFKPTAFIPVAVLEKASSGVILTDEESVEVEKFRQRIGTICKTAFSHDVPVLIDAEDCHYQPLIDDVAHTMMKQYNKERAIVFNTYQMYRTDRLEVLRDDIGKARQDGYKLGAKFVRGAYMERERLRALKKGYPSPIHPTKEQTDFHYDAALALAVENIDITEIFNGTHNEASCLHLVNLMSRHGIERGDTRVWFSQLYGMSDHISFNLASQGYNVAKYMPYGPVKAVLPYLLRRAEENTAIAGQTSRELSFVRKEINRRKNAKKRS